jgi:hypothetical protein
LHIRAAFDEGQELRPGDGLCVDLEGANRHRVRAEFVVERKAGAAAAERAVGCGDAQRFRPLDRGRVGWKVEQRIEPQRLCHVDRGFGVHVFVEQREAEEIQAGVVFGGVSEQGQRVAQAGREVGAHGVGIGQIELPARVVRHQAGVVERVGVHAAGGLACRVARRLRVGVHAQVALRVPSQPPVGKPADVAQLPERQVQLGRTGDAQAWAERVLVGVKQRQAARARFAQRTGQPRLATAARGFGIGHNR